MQKLEEIFYYEDNEEYNLLLLRFYNDGLVIGINISNGNNDPYYKTIEGVLPYFNRNNTLQCQVGRYNMNENLLKFELIGEYGKVQYDGAMFNSSKIELKICSLINGHKRTIVYQRYKNPLYF